MKNKTLSLVLAITTLLSCLLVFSGCDAKGSELAGTVAELPEEDRYSDYYLKIDGIDGDSYDRNFDKWIEVKDFYMGAERKNGYGKGELLPFVFTHEVDIATPYIQDYILNNHRVARAELDVCRACAGKQEVAFKVLFQDLVIVDSQIGMSTDGTNVETVSLKARSVVWTATEIRDGYINGNVEERYNARELGDYNPEEFEIPEKITLPEYKDSYLYANVEGIRGESNDTDHQRWIKLLDYSMGAEASVEYDAVSSTDFKQVTFTHLVDIATPKFQEICASFGYISKIELHNCKPVSGKHTEMFTAVLENSTLIKAEISIDKKGNVLETITLEPEKITWRSTKLRMDNTVDGYVEQYYKKEQ